MSDHMMERRCIKLISEEVLLFQKTYTIDPDEKEFEEATGNEGATVAKQALQLGNIVVTIQLWLVCI